MVPAPAIIAKVLSGLVETMSSFFSSSNKGRRKYRGVRLRSYGRWVAEFRRPDGQRLWLGTFSSPEEAAVAYDQALIESRGPLHKLNFPHLVHDISRANDQSKEEKSTSSAGIRLSDKNEEADRESSSQEELELVAESCDEAQDSEETRRPDTTDESRYGFGLALRQEMMMQGIYEEEYVMNQSRLLRDLAQAMVITPPGSDSLFPFSWPPSPQCDDRLWTNSI